MTFLLINFERPAAGPIYSDEYIERWASVYHANQALRLLGCPFSRFLTRPYYWLSFIGNPVRDLDLDRSYPLTSKEQQILREALRRSATVIDNGRRVEKLKHRAYPRGAMRDFIKVREVGQ